MQVSNLLENLWLLCMVINYIVNSSQLNFQRRRSITGRQKTKLEATCIVDHAIDQSNASTSEPRVFDQFVCRFLLAFSRDFLLFGSLGRDFELGLYWDLKLIGFLNVDGRWSIENRFVLLTIYLSHFFGQVHPLIFRTNFDVINSIR